MFSYNKLFNSCEPFAIVVVVMDKIIKARYL